MTVHEDILSELMAGPITKIVGEPTQIDIDLLEEELMECMAKIKTTEDIIAQGKKYGFLIIVVALAKYITIIRNPKTVWTEPEDSGQYDDSITATDTTFTRSKKEKNTFQKRKRM